MSKAVDAFVTAKVLPEHRDIVTPLRRLMREDAPAASEDIRYGLPMWKVNHAFAWISPSKQGVTFSLARGTQLADRYGLLKGVAGQGSKHVKLQRVADANVTALRSYIRQAVKLDSM